MAQKYLTLKPQKTNKYEHHFLLLILIYFNFSEKCFRLQYMCSIVCSVLGLWAKMTCPNYEVARIGTGVLQPGFQIWTVTNPSLDSGSPTLII